MIKKSLPILEVYKVLLVISLMNLVVDNLTVKREENEILHQISLTFEKGKNYCILGKNGSGKSSLVSVIMGHPFYEIIDGNHYFGAIGSQDTTGTPWYPITSVPLKQVENQNYYNHIQMLSYTAPLNYIDYSADVLFKDGTTLSNYIDTNTLTCTTVTQDTIFTFGAHNYYSLGPNTLIQITQR